MRSLCLLSLIFASSAGCGAGGGTVTGRVSYRDQPVTSGTVLLYTEGGAVHSCLIGADARYCLTDVPLGAARMAVVTHGEVPAGLQSAPPKGHPPYPGVEAAPPRCPHVLIPARYADPDSAGLRLTIRAGEQAFDIALQP